MAKLHRCLWWLALALSPIAWAADITYEWDRSPDPTVTGYRLYLQTNGPSGWTNYVRITTQTNEATVTNVVVGVTLRAYCTATNAAGLESDPSGTLDVVVPAKVLRLRIKARIETTSTLDGMPWQTLAAFPDVDVPIVDGQTFYRVKMDIGSDLY